MDLNDFFEYLDSENNSSRFVYRRSMGSSSLTEVIIGLRPDGGLYSQVEIDSDDRK